MSCGAPMENCEQVYTHTHITRTETQRKKVCLLHSNTPANYQYYCTSKVIYHHGVFSAPQRVENLLARWHHVNAVRIRAAPVHASEKISVLTVCRFWGKNFAAITYYSSAYIKTKCSGIILTPWLCLCQFPHFYYFRYLRSCGEECAHFGVFGIFLAFANSAAINKLFPIFQKIKVRPLSSYTRRHLRAKCDVFRPAQSWDIVWGKNIHPPRHTAYFDIRESLRNYDLACSYMRKRVDYFGCFGLAVAKSL